MAAPSVRELTKRRIESALSSFGPKRPRQEAQSPSPSPSLPQVSPRLQTTSRDPVGGTAATGYVDKFRPWSREDLLARIATYKIQTWLVQSLVLSPVQCARNGWINTDCSTLRCPLCSAMLIAQLPDDLTDDEEVRWIERLSQQLQSSHKSNCPWRDHACAESIYSMPLSTSKEAVESVCQDAVGMLAFKQQLPETTHPLSTFQQGLIRDLQPKVKAQFGNANPDCPAPDDCDVVSALTLTLFGWRADNSMPRAAIKCGLCFRSAGLWLFKNAHSQTSGTTNPEARDDEDETPGTGLRKFNALDEHRPFCYWVRGSAATADTQAKSKNALSANTLPGWQKTVASVLRAKTIDVSSSSGSSISSRSEGTGESANSLARPGASRNAVDANAGASSTQTSALSGRHDTAEDSSILKRLKPFNISAISSAAEAFGIPFNLSLLAQATRRLSSLVPTHHSQQQGGADTANTALNAAAGGDGSILLTESINGAPHLLATSGSQQRLPDAGTVWESDAMPDELHIHEDATEAPHLPESPTDDIPEPIDTSGIASLLGESSLASALEDPAKAQAILEYVKSLLKAKNQAQDSA
ncbi:hypothetical protein GGI12_001252 [Dipsacomyces acuminosporus]|nr:hypothetical protein GGI12_001252 [Dipsacomyces acuminosporus]